MMNDFWIAVAVSLLAVTIYIWDSVFHQLKSNQNQMEQTDNKGNKAKYNQWLLLFPITLLFISPIGYYFIGNLDKQLDWEINNQQFSKIQQGKKASLESMTVPQLFLALRTAIDQEPKNAPLWFMLAEASFQLGAVDIADEAVQKALKIEARPDWYVANAQILSLRANESDIARSLNLLQQALLVQPNHQRALLTLGFIYLKQQQYEPAIAAWQHLLPLLADSGNDVKALQQQIEYAKNQLEQAKNKP